MIDPVQLYWQRRGGKVLRWHTEQFSGPSESVAHHSWGIAILLYAMVEQPSPELIRAAITHDVPECFLGDIPKWAKRALNNINIVSSGILSQPNDHAILHPVQLIEDRISAHMGVTNTLSEHDQYLLHAADYLDCCYTAFDQVLLGNFNFILIFRRLVKQGMPLHPNSIFQPALDWLVHAFMQLLGTHPFDRSDQFTQLLEDTYYWRDEINNKQS